MHLPLSRVVPALVLVAPFPALSPSVVVAAVAAAGQELAFLRPPSSAQELDWHSALQRHCWPMQRGHDCLSVAS